jgi:hypothetical protein
MSIDVLDHGQHAMASEAPAAALATSPMVPTQPVFEDIDKDAVDDPQQCAEYVNDIYAYLREMEVLEDIIRRVPNVFSARSATDLRECTSRPTRT